MKVFVVGDGEEERLLYASLTQQPNRYEIFLVSEDDAEEQDNPLDYRLRYEIDGLGVRRGDSVVRVDFTDSTHTRRRLQGGGRGEMLAKAVGLKRENIIPVVLDATAGLGGDAFVLATLGCRVRMCERVPLVHALLADGLRRAASCDDDVVRAIVARMHLEERDALELFPTLTEENRPDVIYLDPMFPEGRRKSAVKKGMALFHDLVGQDTDADRLLPLALAAARHRVVVKRPRAAPPLADRKPPLTMEGDTTRFDVYPLHSMAKTARTVLESEDVG